MMNFSQSQKAILNDEMPLLVMETCGTEGFDRNPLRQLKGEG